MDSWDIDIDNPPTLVVPKHTLIIYTFALKTNPMPFLTSNPPPTPLPPKPGVLPFPLPLPPLTPLHLSMTIPIRIFKNHSYSPTLPPCLQASLPLPTSPPRGPKSWSCTACSCSCSMHRYSFCSVRQRLEFCGDVVEGNVCEAVVSGIVLLWIWC